MEDSPHIPRGVYAVTDPDLLPGDRLYSAVEAALSGGAVMVQYRDKKSASTERLRHAQTLRRICSQWRAPLIINDDPELAQRVAADGVHLGQSDTDIEQARRLLGPDRIIGVTCHDSIVLAEKARDAGADYLAFGRFFPSVTKPEAPAAHPDILDQAKKLGKPVSAIGGISLENASLLMAHGTDLLAVIGGLFATNDIESRARAFANLIQTYTEQESRNDTV